MIGYSFFKAGSSATPEQLIPMSLLEKVGKQYEARIQDNEKQYEARIQDKEARIQDKEAHIQDKEKQYEARIQDKETWITYWKTECFKLEGKLYPR